MKTNRQLTCGCGTVINLHTNELLSEIARAESELAKLPSALKPLK
jgi:hypothetical protein